jgi:isocitrate lyase
MWWAFNFVSNFANLKYSYMIEDIQKVQSTLEKNMIAQQDSVANVVKDLSKKKRQKMLTNYSNALGEEAHQQWLALGDALITKYNDGYVKDESGKINEMGYPDAWMDELNKVSGDKFKIPEWNKSGRQKNLPY